MNINGKPYRTIWLAKDGWSVEIIDQARLPHELVIVSLKTMEDAARAIKTMQVRGAPLIGATAAFGLCFGLRDDASDAGVERARKLLLATRPNALHRAEVAKVIVHTKVRRRGIGHALMLAVEERARRLGRTTLVLDTRQGDPSERLYTSVGYRLAGAIPAYAKSADGALDPSAFYYRLLTEGGPS